MRNYLLPMPDGPPLYLALRFGKLPLAHREVTSPAAAYAETYWLPTLGPTSLWVARRITTLIERHGPVVVETDSLAAAMGVRPPILCKSLDRLVAFRVAVWDSLDATCPILRLYQVWPEAPERGVKVAEALVPIQERNTNGQRVAR